MTGDVEAAIKAAYVELDKARWDTTRFWGTSATVILLSALLREIHALRIDLAGHRNA